MPSEYIENYKNPLVNSQYTDVSLWNTAKKFPL